MEKSDELSKRLSHLEKVKNLNDLADETLEGAIQERLSLGQTLERMFPVLADGVGSKALVLKTYDEDLRLREFFWGEGNFDLYEKVKDTKESRFNDDGENFLVGQSLDVAGEWFGMVAVIFEEKPSKETGELIDVWCEELDNFLASIAQSRLKHQVTNQIADSLTQSVLDVGISGAIEILQKNVKIDDLLLVYYNEDSMCSALHYLIILDGQVKYDSHVNRDQEMDQYLHDHFEKIDSPKKELPKYFGLDNYFEEQLIYGVFRKQVVGRIIVGRKSSEFNTFDRDLLDIFSTYLRQRVVDFNREYKQLSSSFCSSVVERLMNEEDYSQKYLQPKEYPVAIMYTDIASFTKISEQVLKKPALIGALINEWSQQVVEIIWKNGGVFDKLVGDCIIGLWGPPFKDYSSVEACEKAIEAAKKIKEYTASLSDGLLLKELKGLDTGVSTGLNYCPLFVGQFGPNNSYTGFSSGMNNTARLQGLAEFQQILCMDDFVTASETTDGFGPSQNAKVKNVAEPLKFHELL